MFFTTDHPNGAPFTAYPDLLALLMDRNLRDQWMAELPKSALSLSTLGSIRREYDWPEIAIMTRAAPARLLGLADRGHLGPGARADIAAYRPQADRAAMFRHAALVLKDGDLVVRDGQVIAERPGRTVCFTPPARPDAALERYYQDAFGISRAAFDVPSNIATFEPVPCR